MGYRLLICSVVCATAGFANAQVLRPDDPIQVDRDDLPSPLPSSTNVDDWFDGVSNLFGHPGEEWSMTRALNVNTLGEVPDSSWFTNRMGLRPMSRGELQRGPNRSDGPADGVWTVTSGKTEGVTPGFTIVDERGEPYIIKFDPASNPEMATAADVIGTKFFHALGYNVPENYLATFQRARLRLSPSATVKDLLGKKRSMTEADLARILRRVAPNPDGSIRVIASKLLAGKPIGPFRFSGTRDDDLNDLFRHEHRRELRGYAVFCAWLNHDDSRAVNTLDMYVGEPDAGHVVHHLIDFGSILGSGSVRTQTRRAGNEYILEWRPVFKSLATVGLWPRSWSTVKYDEYVSVGRFEGSFFAADRWRPEYPNPAFDHLDLEDAYWAALRVMAFSDDDIRAIVETGQLSLPAAAGHLVNVLIERRDKIGQHWLRQLAPFERFRIEADRLVYGDVLVRLGLEPASPQSTVTFARFDNDSGEQLPIGSSEPVVASSVGLPAALRAAEVGTIWVARLAGMPPVDVFLRRAAVGVEVVAIERNAPRVPALPHSRIQRRD